MVKFWSIAQCSVDPFSHPVMPCLYSFCASILHSHILFNVFILVFILDILLHVKHFCFDLSLLLSLISSKVSPTCVTWWFFTRVWVTETLFKSPGLFSVFRPISTLLCLDGLHWFSYFQILQSLYQSFGDCTERINQNWFHRHFHVSQLFSSLARFRCLSLFSVLSSGQSEWQSPLFCRFSFFFFCRLSLGLVVWPKLGDQFVSQNPCEICVSHFPVRILGCAYIIRSYYYLLIRVFHISVSWWFFTWFWVTASLLKSPVLFSVFWLFSIM